MAAAGSSLGVVLVPSTPSPTAGSPSRRLSQQRFTIADSPYVHTSRAVAQPRIVHAQESPSRRRSDGPTPPLRIVQRSPACARSASMSEALRLASPSLAPPPTLLLWPLITDPSDPSYPCDAGKENLSTPGKGKARAPVSVTAKATTAVDMFASVLDSKPPRHAAASPRSSFLAEAGLGAAQRPVAYTHLTLPATGDGWGGVGGG